MKLLSAAARTELRPRKGQVNGLAGIAAHAACPPDFQIRNARSLAHRSCPLLQLRPVWPQARPVVPSLAGKVSALLSALLCGLVSGAEPRDSPVPSPPGTRWRQARNSLWTRWPSPSKRQRLLVRGFIQWQLLCCWQRVEEWRDASGSTGRQVVHARAASTSSALRRQFPTGSARACPHPKRKQNTEVYD